MSSDNSRGGLIIFRFYFVLLVFAVDCAVAGDASLEEMRASEARRYTVNIDVSFPAKDQPGHLNDFGGSGVIVSLSEGIIFTCKHVIEEEEVRPERLKVRFNTSSGTPVSVPAEVLGVSRLYDFAVLKFDPKKLGQARQYVREVPLPTPEEFFNNSKQGAAVLVYGNPKILSNVATFGNIIRPPHAPDWAISDQIAWPVDTYLKTDSAVSQGNSGGPAIALKSGHILGMVTSFIEEAQNLNLVLPILPMLEEWERMQTEPNYQRENFLGVRFAALGIEALRREKLMPMLTAAIPRFANYYEGALMVDFALPDSGLRPGDDSCSN